MLIHLFFDRFAVDRGSDKNLKLIENENLLQENQRSLHEFKGMPYPDSYVTRHIGNRLIHDERDYNVNTERQNFHNLFRALTSN